MLSKCVNCSFYVRQDDEFCLNCGLNNPTVLITDSKAKAIKYVSVFVVSFILTLIVSLVLYSNKASVINSLALSVLISMVIITGFEIFEFRRTRNRENSNQNNLKNKSNVIKKRVNELSARSGKIDSVLDKINHDDSTQLQQVRQKLLSAREIIIGQFARYELQDKKIQLVRLQNSVAPYLFGINRLNEPEMDNGLVTIENTKTEINLIRQNLTRYDAIDFPPKVLPEKESFLAQLDETETSCERLREALLSRQAALALRGISPLEETAKIPASKELMHEADVFNIQTTITDFSESFDELENEYRRLKSEDEISRLTDFQEQ